MTNTPSPNVPQPANPAVSEGLLLSANLETSPVHQVDAEDDIGAVRGLESLRLDLVRDFAQASILPEHISVMPIRDGIHVRKTNALPEEHLSIAVASVKPPDGSDDELLTGGLVHTTSEGVKQYAVNRRTDLDTGDVSGIVKITYIDPSGETTVKTRRAKYARSGAPISERALGRLAEIKSRDFDKRHDPDHGAPADTSNVIQFRPREK